MRDLPYIQACFDNPSYRVFRGARQRRSRSMTALFTLCIAGALAISVPQWDGLGIMPWAVGQLLFGGLTGLYMFFTCLVLVSGIEDPLRVSVAAGVADQLILTGLSPGTRAQGLLLLWLENWLEGTAAFLPLFGLCLFLGGGSVALVATVLWLGLITSFTTCLFLNVGFATFGVGGFVVFALAWCVSSFGALAPTPTLTYAFAPLWCLNPLAVLWDQGSQDLFLLPAGMPLTRTHDLLVSGCGAVPPLLYFTLGHLALWLLALPWLVLGPGAETEGFLAGLRTPQPTRQPGPRGNGIQGSSRSPARALPLFQACALFYENAGSARRWWWECAGLTGITLAGIYVATRYFATLFCAPVPIPALGLTLRVEQGVAVGVCCVLPLAAVLLFCFAPDSRRRPDWRQALGLRAGFLLLQLLIAAGFVCGMFPAPVFGHGRGMTGLALLWFVVYSAGLLALAVTASLSACNRTWARLRCAGAVAAWLLAPPALAWLLCVALPGPAWLAGALANLSPAYLFAGLLLPPECFSFTRPELYAGLVKLTVLNVPPNLWFFVSATTLATVWRFWQDRGPVTLGRP